MYQCMYVCMNVYMFVCMHVYMGYAALGGQSCLPVRRGDLRSMTAALQQFHWLPVKYRIDYKLLFIFFELYAIERRRGGPERRRLAVHVKG